jgi:cysteine desulfurase
VIYLDHHATTPLSNAARDAMRAALEEPCANPSSVHTLGRKTRNRIETARTSLANALGAMPRELVFTSGGTEAVHLCVRGIGDGIERLGGGWVDPGAHPALRAAAERLAARRNVPLHQVPSDTGGAPRIEALRAEVEAAGGGLVALSLVQHETGAISPVRAIADALRGVGGVVVVDAVQALGKVAIDAPSSGAIAMAFSAHKIGGPVGAGAAWIAADARVRGAAGGGGQERGLRAGTENVVGIVGIGAAAAEVRARVNAMERVRGLRDRIESVMRGVDGVAVNGAERERVATACHVSVRGIAGEELVAALDLEGVCVSSGPACSSGRPGPSASMRALYPDEAWRASSAVRVTLGVETTAEDVDTFLAAFERSLARFRREADAAR